MQGYDKLVERQERNDYVQRFAENGRVVLEVWQMDCDCSSWTSYGECLASAIAVEAEMDKVYQYAEGPVRFTLIKPSDRPDQPPEPRDHALEAFEDGHPHVVYV